MSAPVFPKLLARIEGGLLGLRYGVASIPARWRDTLRGQEILAPLRDALLARRQAG